MCVCGVCVVRLHLRACLLERLDEAVEYTTPEIKGLVDKARALWARHVDLYLCMYVYIYMHINISKCMYI